MKKCKFEITAEPLVDLEDITDFEEIGCLGDVYTIEAVDEEAAWDRFHDTVAIANVNDFQLSIKKATS